MMNGPAVKAPTWDEALAHAEVLREQGVNVGIDERSRVIEIRGDNGKRHDADGTPAWQCFYSDGSQKVVEHWTNGRLHDPADGIPAVQWSYPDGSPEVIGHWTNGKFVSEERFPPIGEA